jgi:succinate dehydrogenase/fumarate reductase flavoprotein subunit
VVNTQVVICTGGFAADLTGADSLLKRHRPDLAHLPTTNGEHCTGDGIKMAEVIGAQTYDIDSVQVHPTGLVHPADPEAAVKFLAAEALRGVGGILIDARGNRFCDELGRRDYVTGQMNTHQGPFRLVLNSKVRIDALSQQEDRLTYYASQLSKRNTLQCCMSPARCRTGCQGHRVALQALRRAWPHEVLR